MKKVFYRLVIRFIKERWRLANKPRILLFTNQFFTKQSWNSALDDFFLDPHKNYDILFCKNKYEVIKHFEKADVCFLYGYNPLFSDYQARRKLLYFPSQGLDFLIGKSIPEIFSIDGPPPYSAIAIAEYTLSMAILIDRKLHIAINNQAQKKWNQVNIIKEPFQPLSYKTIGILGIGNVGAAVAEIFKKTGCTIWGCDKVDKRNSNFIDKWFSITELSSFLRGIDFLILTLPLTDSTKKIIGKQELEQMKNSSYIINVSRGGILNEKDLVQALMTKRIKGAVLDVFTVEPLPRFSDLYKLNNVIITPHIAGNINMFISEIQKDFLVKISNFLS